MGKLPINDVILSSDASTTYGMAGVLTFEYENREYPGLAGLFWQVSWAEWAIMAHMPSLRPGVTEINVAEFIAALITCETFTDFCKGRLTTLKLDNTTAKTWIDTARCTGAPFDRCAQGIHLYLLKRNMKVITSWVSSADNVVADACSRHNFPRRAVRHEHVIEGNRFRRISPKFTNLLRFMK